MFYYCSMPYQSPLESLRPRNSGIYGYIPSETIEAKIEKLQIVWADVPRSQQKIIDRQIRALENAKTLRPGGE